MNFETFVGQVQNRLQLPDMGRGVRAARAVLQTLGERLPEADADALTKALPREIDQFVHDAEAGQEFPYREFVKRIAEIERSDPPDASYHAQLVMQIVAEAIPESVLERVRNALPGEYEKLFEQVGRASASTE